MKTKLLCVLLLGAPAASAIAGDVTDPFVGAWEVVYGEYGLAEGRVEIDQSARPVQLKVFGSSRFAYVRHAVDGSFQAASAGSYTISGNRYTETTNWSSVPAALGTRVTFEFRLSGDAVCMTGPVEVIGSDGKPVEGLSQMREVMRRAGTTASGPEACGAKAPRDR